MTHIIKFRYEIKAKQKTNINKGPHFIHTDTQHVYILTNTNKNKNKKTLKDAWPKYRKKKLRTKKANSTS